MLFINNHAFVNNNNNNNNNNNKLYSVHIPTYIQVADVGMIQLGHMAAH